MHHGSSATSKFRLNTIGGAYRLQDPQLSARDDKEREMMLNQQMTEYFGAKLTALWIIFTTDIISIAIVIQFLQKLDYLGSPLIYTIQLCTPWEHHKQTKCVKGRIKASLTLSIL
jgi:RNAse (barnase) inhibitor barstar